MHDVSLWLMAYRVSVIGYRTYRLKLIPYAYAYILHVHVRVHAWSMDMDNYNNSVYPI